MGGKNQLKKQNSGQETIDVKMIELEEIHYNLDSDPELEANSELIKYEFNMIELPFFTKDRNIEDGKARKYIFSEKDNSYMMVSPSGAPGLISHKIPQEFDEKVFYGILKLSKEQNSKEVITDYFTLAKVSDVPYNKLERIKDSIERLSRCTIELQNLFYNAEMKRKIIGKEPFPILQHAFTYSFDQTVKLPEDKKEKYQKYFRNSKINEILILTFSDHMYKNLEHKGFLYFNQKELLEIDNATARKMFMLIKKWHGWEKKSIIKRSCRFLASRLPLSWEKSNIPGTINVIENACETLKQKDLILNFALIRNKPLGNSYVEFHFGDESSKLIDYNMKAASVTTGHEGLVINSVEDEFLEEDKQMNIFESPALKETVNLFELIPEQSRNDSNRKTIEQYADRGADFIRSNIEYTKKNCKDNFDAYLKKSLTEDWAKSEREKAEYLRKLEIEAKRKEKEEKDRIRREAEEKRKKAEDTYNSMTQKELETLEIKAERHPMYLWSMKSRIEKGEITKEEALKETGIVILMG